MNSEMHDDRSKICDFSFSQEGLQQLRRTVFGENWPVVYLLNDRQEMYIGESSSVTGRMKAHWNTPERRQLDQLHVIYDEQFNKSVILDLESLLIQLFVAEGRFRLQNANGGQDQKHNYYQRDKYEDIFRQIWDQLREKELATRELEDIRNSDLFKFSPYHTLTTEQYQVYRDLAEHVQQVLAGQEEDFTAFVTGAPGTGKSVLAVFLVRKLKELYARQHQGQELKIGLVISMTPLRQTLKRVFAGVPGLRASMVLSPPEVTRQRWDMLIVDEAHRLKQRVNLTSYAAFDQANARLGLDRDEGTELDWVLRQSRIQILFYDPKQSVKPTDVPAARFEELRMCAGFQQYSLQSQMRVLGGEDYIRYIRRIFSDDPPETSLSFAESYTFCLYEHLPDMLAQIRNLEEVWGLARVAAGYAWPWKTRPLKTHEAILEAGAWDFEIEGIRLIWNSTTADWIGQACSRDEVGCIHTLQGYDLNYAGIIIGPDLSYDWNERRLVIRREHYHDRKGVHKSETEAQVRAHILNIYQVLLTRGIRGTLVYACDPDLRRYLARYIPGPVPAL